MARRMTRVAASIGSSVNLPKPEIGLAVDRHTHTLSLFCVRVCVFFCSFVHFPSYTAAE
jgi:hypothetical protein